MPDFQVSRQFYIISPILISSLGVVNCIFSSNWYVLLCFITNLHTILKIHCKSAMFQNYFFKKIIGGNFCNVVIFKTLKTKYSMLNIEYLVLNDLNKRNMTLMLKITGFKLKL